MTNLTSLLTSHPEIEYVVGSVHHVDGISIDFDRPTWLRAIADCGSHSQTMARSSSGTLSMAAAKNEIREPQGIKDLEPFLEAYLDAQFEMLQQQEPEVVGHFDLCLLWTPEISLKESERVWRKVERNVDFAVAYGALFEANAAAIRKGWKSSYPSPDVLRLILQRGGRICLSDDSHGVSYVGLNYGKMREYLVNEGVKEIWYLVPGSEEGERVGNRGRVKARKLEGWAENDFWQGK